MSKSLLTAVVAATLLFTPASFAYDRPTTWYETTDISMPSNTTSASLNNGLRYVILPTSRSSDEVSIRIRIGSGVDQEPQLQPVARALAINTVAGTDWHAITDSNQTVFSIDLLHATFSQIEQSMTAIKNGLTNKSTVLDSQELLERAQSVLTDNSQVADDMLTARKTTRAFDVQSADTLDTDALSRYQTRYYQPNNISVVITGGIKNREIIQLMTKQFASWQPNHNVKPINLAEQTSAITQVQEFITDDSLALLTIKPLGSGADSKQQRKDILTALLANKLIEQRIAKALEQEQSTASVNVDHERLFSQQLVSQIRVTGLAAGEADKAQQLVKNEIRRAVAAGFTQTEYEMIVSQVREQLQGKTRLNNSHYSRDQAERIVAAINQGMVYTDPSYDLDLLNFHVAHMNEFDISDVFEQLWAKDKVRQL